jgi:hypothetical protein
MTTTASAPGSSTERPPARPSIPTVDIGPDPRAGATAVWLRRAFLALLAVIVLAGLFELLGVRSRTVSAASADGSTHVRVKYAQVARAGLDVPFEITVQRAGGFDGPVLVAVSSDYLGLFDRNALDPEPSSATATADETIWQFDPPAGDTLVVSFDLQVQSGRHWGKHGTVSVLDPSGNPLVRASFKTWLAP